jgi:hypothetical protein
MGFSSSVYVKHIGSMGGGNKWVWDGSKGREGGVSRIEVEGSSSTGAGWGGGLEGEGGWVLWGRDL